MATPVGYANAMFLGLNCKLSEGSCRKAALNRWKICTGQTNKHTDRQKRSLYCIIIHSELYLKFEVSSSSGSWFKIDCKICSEQTNKKAS